MMLTTDLALRVDPIYEPIARRFYENPDQLADAFARAWYKLLHRDMGPLSRYLGPWVAASRSSGRTRCRPSITTWSATPTSPPSRRRSSTPACRSRSWSRRRGPRPSSFRGTDKRGGANGARIRLAPQKDWAVNEPAELATVLSTLEQIQQEFNGSSPAARRSRSPT